MKIALYYPWIYLTSGAERLILELTGHSDHHWTIFTNRFEAENTYPEFKERRLIELSPRISVKRSFAEVMKAAVAIFRQTLPIEEFDALVVVCEGVGDFILFKNSRIPCICICLTPLRPVFDPIYKERYLDGKGIFTACQLAVFGKLFAMIDRIAWKKYHRIFCISQEVADRVGQGKLTSADKLDIAYPGIHPDKFTPSWNYDSYFFLPGRIMWTKNIELGIRSFKLFLKQNPSCSHFQLKIAGIVDKKSESYLESLKQLSENDPRIQFIIHPTDAELHELYSNCLCTLFTAFNEDWGIVPLEGMAMGKPCIAVNRGGPRETIVHGENGWLMPVSAADFAKAMTNCALNKEQIMEMGKKCIELCKQFDWSYFVEKIDDYLESLA
jgi:glycosyltransferase involved in cell wall biosynthesis